VAAENKARNILVLDMRGVTPLYDFFVLVTGNSRRQIHTVTEEIDAALGSAATFAFRWRGTRPAPGWSRTTAM